MSTVKVNPRVLGDWLRAEAKDQYSRAVKTLLSGQKIVSGEICSLDSAGKAIALVATGDEIHTYTLTVTPTAGTFTISLFHPDGYWVTTTDLQWDDSDANVLAALNQALIGADSGAVTQSSTGAGTAITVVTITFGGTGFTSLTHPLGQMDVTKLTSTTGCVVTRSTAAGVGQDEVQTITAEATMTGGTIGITIWTPATGAYAHDVPLYVNVAWNTNWATTMADLNTAITAAATAWAGTASVGVVLTGDMNKDIVATYSGVGFTLLPAPRLCLLDLSGTTSCTYADIVRTTAGGVAGNRIGCSAAAIAVAALDGTATHESGSAGDRTGVFIVRDAIINEDSVVYGGGDVAGSLLALKALGILSEAEQGTRILPQ